MLESVNNTMFLHVSDCSNISNVSDMFLTVFILCP